MPSRMIRRSDGSGQVAISVGSDDPWTLYSRPRALTVQYEHTAVATRNGPLILTMPGA
jgi:hypothetical protein